MSVKLCQNCNEVKSLEDEFYKAGKSWQKLCKKCHNKGRYKYKLTPSKYIKKPKGFNKLDKNIRDGIIYDLHVKMNYKCIANKYNISYYTILNWKKKDMIPEYDYSTIEEHQPSMTAT